jgi:hypothetical protein
MSPWLFLVDSDAGVSELKRLYKPSPMPTTKLLRDKGKGFMLL